MKQIVIMPGGFHPFHAGHYALYKSALDAFPEADVYVAATNDQKARPFPFAIKEKLAKLAGVALGRFIQVKSPFKATEITDHYDPEEDVLIFVRSEKDRNEQPKPGGTKKDGTPAYFQPWTGKDLKPFSQHAYIDYLPTVEFGPGIKSATEIRNAWPNLNDKQKTAMVMSLYPDTQKNQRLAKNVVGMLDQVMSGEQGVAEGSTDDGDDYDDGEYRLSGRHGLSADPKKMAVYYPNDPERTKIRTQMNIPNLKKAIQSNLGKHKKPNLPEQGVAEDKESDPIIKTVLSFYKPVVNDIHKEKLPDYVEQARELMHKADPATKQKLLDIFKKGKENPYLQGGIITTVGALLAGGILNTSQSMGLTPQQTNIALQAILNTVIPTLVSRINGRNWKDTIKYTLASAGVGTGIASIAENKVSQDMDYLEEK